MQNSKWSQNESSFAQPLPFWQRFLFATILPNLVALGTLYFAFLYMVQIVNHDIAPSGGPNFGAIALAFSTSVLLVFIGITSAVLTFLAAFRPWVQAYDAFRGGILLFLCSIPIGGVFCIWAAIITFLIY